MNWAVDKLDMENLTGLPADALHILSGMLILLAAAFLLRRPPWSWQAWLVVVVAETLNETYDLIQTIYPTDEGNFSASLHDFWLTLFCPTMILLFYSRFVGIDPEGGVLAPIRRAVLSRRFLIGFAVAFVVGLLGGVCFW